MASTVIQPSIALVAPFADPVYALKSDNGTFKGLFTQTIGTNNAVMFQSNGYSFSWKPDNILYIDDANNMDVVYGVNPSASAQYWNNKVTYVGTTQLTSDVFECLNNQLKHTVNLVAPPRLPASYMGTPVNVAVGGVISYDSSLSIVADGAKQTSSFTTNGGLSFQDATGKEVYSLPKIFAQDANGDIADGSYKVTFNSDGTISLYLMVAWSWLQLAAYPVAIDPTVVTSSVYDTSGNGGRKIVELANGRIVVITLNGTTIYAYKSDDKGTTWAQLCTVSGANSGASIANIGNNCTIVFVSSPTAYSVTFDGTTVTNTDQNANKKTIDTQTSVQNTTSVTSDGAGVLHASYTSKNGTYPNSNNIRYSKSTDGGTTWATPTQITTLNTSGWYAQNPCIVVRSNNLPTIVWETYQGSSVQSIMAATWNGTTWNAVTVYAGGSYNQANVCGAVDGSDAIHVVWSGYDASSPSHNNIYYSKSTDGGSTWSSALNLTNQNSYSQFTPSIAIDINNVLYIFWYGIDPAISTTYYNIRKITFSNSLWSAITAITSSTTTHEENPQTLWSKFNENGQDAIRYIWEDTQTGVKYDSINLDNPPNAPTLNPTANFDSTIGQTFTWNFSSPNPGSTQSKYELQIVDVSNGSTVLDTAQVSSTQSSYTLPPNTSGIINGHSYQWRVQTQDQFGSQGPYSTYGTFSCAITPTVYISSPASDNLTITTSKLTASWVFTDLGGNSEQSYEVQITDTSDVVLWDSGTIKGQGASILCDYNLSPSGSYKVKVKATNSLGITSVQVVRPFTTSFTPPATPTTALSAQSGYISLAITNPTPTGQQPTIAYNDVYRRETGTTAWTRIATNVANNGTYSDYAVASGQSYDYKVTAVGNNQTISDSAVSSQSITFRGLMVHQVSNPSGLLNLLYQTQPKSDEWIPQATQLKFAGRTNTVVQFGENEDFTLSGAQTVLMDSDNQWSALNTMIRSKSTLCVRDGRGRKIFAAVVDLKTTDLEFGRQVDLEFIQVDFTEAV